VAPEAAATPLAALPCFCHAPARFVLLRAIGRFVEAAAQRGDQRRMRTQPFCLNLRDAFLRASNWVCATSTFR